MTSLHRELRFFPYEQAMLNELNQEGYISLPDMFERACNDFADRPAFTSMGQTLTFREVEQASRSFAAYLQGARGLVPGERIAIQLPNIAQYPIVAWGALRAGLVLVNTNPLYTARELLHQFNDAGVSALVCLADLLPVLEEVVPQTGIRASIVTQLYDLMEAQPALDTVLENVATLPDAIEAGSKLKIKDCSSGMNDVAVLQYTGGTTDVAKGAVLTHGNILASAKQSASIVPVDPNVPDVVIAPMPLHHIHGFTMNIVSVFCAGGHSVLIADPRDIAGMIATMKAHPFTALAGVDTLFNGLMQNPDFDSIDFSRVKGVVSGGAALVEKIGAEWFNRTGSEIFEGYGLSETAATLSCNSPEFRQLGSVGKPMPCVEVKLINEQGKTLGQGEEGELLVRGPQVMHGYWQRPEATAEALDAEGWFRTGDIAMWLDDGFIKVCDRLKDMILVSGFNVYPNEIEAVVYTHPDVTECAVVGVADEKTGEAVKLFVVSTNSELNMEALRSYCREQLTAYKVPKFIEFRKDLPKSSVGKILRRELRQ
ncbi:MAG: long-chain acyl-CoA synthetase [Halieaceae bacterium]|jgi:long-chain acyl-CoA synthetase